jgi:cell division protease FtsH
VHTKKIPLGDDVELNVIARGTPRFAGADLANLVNEAALIAARQNRKVVTMHDFELAKDKVLMGVERKSRSISDGEKKHTAYHEAGHALVAAKLPEAMPLHKVTIIPRGMTLGVTMFLPEGDQVDYTREQARAQIAVSMAGRIADEIFCNMKSAGASNDIEKATELSRKMVCEWGMSDLGPISFGKKEEQIFLGREIATHRDFSEATAMRIDEMIQNFVKEGYDRAKEIIQEHREAMIRVAEALLEREVLDAHQVKMLIDGETLPPFKSSTDKPAPAVRPEGGLRVPGLMEGPGPQPA